MVESKGREYEDKYYAYDLFQVYDPRKVVGTKWESVMKSPTASLLPGWKYYVQNKLYPSAKSFAGFINSESNAWKPKPVDVFSLDSAKDAKQYYQMMNVVVPYLRPGSLVIFGDFVYPPKNYHQITHVYTQLIPSGKFELVDVSPSTSHWTFAVKENVGLTDFNGSKNNYKVMYNESQWSTFLERAIADMDRVLEEMEELSAKDFVQKMVKDCFAAAHS